MHVAVLPGQVPLDDLKQSGEESSKATLVIPGAETKQPSDEANGAQKSPPEQDKAPRPEGTAANKDYPVDLPKTTFPNPSGKLAQ